MKDFLMQMVPEILNMSLTASAVILVVLAVRWLLRSAPRIFSYALWAVVFFRLLCPVSFTADFSLLQIWDPPVKTQNAAVSTVEYLRPTAKPAQVLPTPDAPPPPAEDWPAAAPAAPSAPEKAPAAAPAEGKVLPALTCIWAVGVLGMLGLSGVSCLRLRRRLVGAVPWKDQIYLADHIDTPFVLGLVRPKIYLPSFLEEQEQAYILLHERHHIHRGDPIWKALAFAALILHWFNPLVWLAFYLMVRDMEMSCDEAVMRKTAEDIRSDYSASLLRLATGRQTFAGMPLAFGEGDTGRRIRNVLNWKKPALWISLLAAVACVVVVILCAANPGKENQGKYESVEAYTETVLKQQKKDGAVYYTPSGQERTAKVLDTRTVRLDQEGELDGLAPEGRLEAWTFEYLLKIDAEPEQVQLAGGMSEEDGWFDLEGQGGHTLVALQYQDGSCDILLDQPVNDGVDFYGGRSVPEALHDWYVQKEHLDLPLYYPAELEDWIDELDLPHGVDAEEFPARRYDGSGWYFYVPVQGWEKGDAFGHFWNSRANTSSQLMIDELDQDMEAAQLAAKMEGYAPRDGSMEDGIWKIWENDLKDPTSVYYFFEKPDGGVWKVTIGWDRQRLAESKAPLAPIEPEILEQMAKSFTVDDRFSQNGAEPIWEMDGVRTGDRVELFLQQGKKTQRYQNPWEAMNGTHQFHHLSCLEWKESQGLDLDQWNGAQVTLVSERWNLTAYEGSRVVLKETGDDSQWLEVNSEDVFDDPYDILRSWVDELEFQMLDLPQNPEDVVVLDKGQSWQEAAATAVQQYEERCLNLPSPGSKFRYSFVKTQVDPVDPETQMHLQKDGMIGKNQYGFYLTTIFVPENERALLWNLAGNTEEYSGKDPEVPKGAYEYGRCCTIEKASDGWHVRILGTGW